jgi:hypothetical protein
MVQEDKISRAHTQLADRKVILEGEWTADEAQRILAVFERIEALSGRSSLDQFNGQTTTFHHSDRPGRVGRTRGGDIYLDADWTDWTMAHELGHRWNNAWGRAPERDLRQTLRAGRWEWLKRGLRRFEKWLEWLSGKLGKKAHIDWQALWYHPGDAPPPCGVDRNFNAAEDLAECFASTVFPEDARIRAAKAAGRLARRAREWDWGSQYDDFSQTHRGAFMQEKMRNLSANQD